MKTWSVTTVSELLKSVQELSVEGRHCYRGQASVGWGLVPSLYRGLDAAVPPMEDGDAGGVGRLERDVYRQFGIRGRQFLPQTVRSPWEELSIAQHHGVPTRLLDWSLNPLVAAYFAVAEGSQTDAAIWALNLYKYPFDKLLGRAQPNGAHRIENLQSFLGQRTAPFLQPASQPVMQSPCVRRRTLAVFEAPAIVPRLAAQQGLFSVHLATADDLVTDHGREVQQAELRLGMDLMTRIDISRGAIDEFREQLPIEPTSIYPDLEGVAVALRRQTRKELGNLLAER